MTRFADHRGNIARIVAVSAVVVLLLDVIPIWLLSVTTIYGQAGDTSVVAMLLFAMTWFVLPGLAVLVRSRWALPAVIVLGGAARLLLQAGISPDVQVYASSATLLMLLCWAVLAARHGDFDGLAVAFGFGAGVAASVSLRVALGGVPPMWSPPVIGWGTVLALVALACGSTLLVLRHPSATVHAPGRLWFAIWPALLLVLLVTGAPLRATVAVVPDHRTAQLLIVAACVGGVALTLLAQRSWIRPVGAALFFICFCAALLARATVNGIHGVLPSWAVLPQAAAALSLGLVLGAIATSPTSGNARRHQLSVWGGQLFFFVVIFLFFASEAVALPFPGVAIPLSVAALLTLLAVRSTSSLAAPGQRPRLGARTIGVTVAAGAACVLVGVPSAIAPIPPAPSAGSGYPVRFLSYNVHVGGVSLGGQYELDRMIDLIKSERADVIWISEMDRGWVVDGDHDAVPRLARELGMRYVYAPAAAPDWGDLVLSRFPITINEQRMLPAAGAPTGAQALSVTIDLGEGQRLGLIGTHLQTLDDNLTVPPEQARAVADMATRLMRAGDPVVVAGDLNDKPGSVALESLDKTLNDGLLPWRPVFTFPADDPVLEIDHVYVSPDLEVSDLKVRQSQVSDHLPISVTLSPR